MQMLRHMPFYAVVVAMVSCMPHRARCAQPPPPPRDLPAAVIQKLNPASCLTAVAADGAPGKIAQGRPAMMPDWEKDYEAGRAILKVNDLPVFECPLHLEGGSIHSDGEG
jgi:hypothetical protein